MAANYTFTNIADKVLLWLHGRRLGVRGDGQGPTPATVLVLDGIPVGSTRSGPNAIKAVVAGSNGVGAITVTGAKVGDSVEMVINLTSPADASSSFEASVSVAGQVQQTSASNLSGSTFLFLVQPTQ